VNEESELQVNANLIRK